MPEVLSQHVGLITGLFAVGYLGAALLSISRGSTTTALALLQHAGTVEVAVGVAVISLPPALLVVCGLIAHQLIHGPRTNVHLWSAVLYFVALVLTPISLLIGGVFTFAFIQFLVWLWRHRQRRHPASDVSFVPYVLVVAVLFVAHFLVLPDRPWIAPEVISTDAGAAVGFVLEDDGESVVVLRAGDRRVIRLETEAITDRQLCDTPGDLGSSSALYSWLQRRQRPSYPDCNDLVAQLNG